MENKSLVTVLLFYGKKFRFCPRPLWTSRAMLPTSAPPALPLLMQNTQNAQLVSAPNVLAPPADFRHESAASSAHCLRPCAALLRALYAHFRRRTPVRLRRHLPLRRS